MLSTTFIEISKNYGILCLSPKPTYYLCLVRRSTDISSTSSPVDVDMVALRVFLASVFFLDLESMCAKVVSLSLEKVGREILCAVTVEP